MTRIKRILTLASSVLAVLLVFSVFLPSASASSDGSGRSAGVVITTQGNLNVRSTANTSSPIVSALPKGSLVTLLTKSGGWWQVEYADGYYGWCSASYIRQNTNSAAAYVSIGSGKLNVRASAGGSIIGSLYRGDNVIIVSSSGGWHRVVYNGTRAGWVSASYITKYSSGYNRIILDVPDYKQYDTRWSGSRLGGSGYTVGSSGCTTTCIAMTESFRTGTTVYPSTLSRSLTYTSGGLLVWPSTYSTAVPSDYLSALYSQLKQGKPVVLGAKTSSGSQHWVVVTGFTGGALTPSAFLINDPGTTSRTTLADLYGTYHYFYKIAYYN